MIFYEENSVMVATGTHRVKPIRYVGAWAVDANFRIATTEKPAWFHRLFVKILLGRKWEDEA